MDGEKFIVVPDIDGLANGSLSPHRNADARRMTTSE
jgi:hypothetical protein